MVASFRLHASCAARDGAGVLLQGPPGAGKSDLLIRLIDRGFSLVADDWVEVNDGWASPAEAGTGLLEIHGLGIVRLPYHGAALLVLAVRLEAGARMPLPQRCPELGLPLVHVDPKAASAALRVAWALDCLQGRLPQLAGAFA